MDRYDAVKTAVELTTTLLGSVKIEYVPNRSSADSLADFIETLAARLEKIDEE